MRTLLLLSILLLSISCKNNTKGNPDRFKKGVFEVPAGDNYSKTIITRTDSLNIEKYTKSVSVLKDGVTTEETVEHTDTLYIKWANNFAYTLKMKNPKTQLDKETIFVQITKVTDSAYDFTAKIGYSKFTQKGTINKIK